MDFVVMQSFFRFLFLQAVDDSLDLLLQWQHLGWVVEQVLEMIFGLKTIDHHVA